MRKLLPRGRIAETHQRVGEMRSTKLAIVASVAGCGSATISVVKVPTALELLSI